MRKQIRDYCNRQKLHLHLETTDWFANAMKLTWIRSDLRRLLSWGVLVSLRWYCYHFKLSRVILLCWPIALINIYSNCHKCYSSLFKRCFVKETEEFSWGKGSDGLTSPVLGGPWLKMSSILHPNLPRKDMTYQKLFSLFFFLEL